MSYNIDLPRQCTINGRLFRDGVYRVPQDISEGDAKVAQSDHGAKPFETQPIRTVKRRGRPKNTPAPENKSLSAASENKTEQDLPDAASEHYSEVE